MRSKYPEIKKRLPEIKTWATEGLYDSDIARRLGISLSTFYDYQGKYPEFSDTLKSGKEKIDYAVEQALLKRAMGYEYEETIKEPGFDGELRVTKIVTKQVVPDTTAQIFWLKNRRPDIWRDKQNVEHSGAIKTGSFAIEVAADEQDSN